MQLEAKNICFGYNKKGKFILNNVNMTCQTGERIAIVGPSGYGKSTLAKILAGYLAPIDGEVLIDHQALPKKGVCPIQLIYQHPEKAINPRFRMKQVLEEAKGLDPGIMTKLGIEKQWLTRFPREVSGGELQRFCVARALLPETKFLIADEMSTMLDVITQAQLWHVILEEVKERNMGLIMITHNMALAKQTCDRVIDITTINQS